ncbi:hypothetical protein KUCAC02_026648, partial [Chaenocephalus aceratus]
SKLDASKPTQEPAWNHSSDTHVTTPFMSAHASSPAAASVRNVIESAKPRESGKASERPITSWHRRRRTAPAHYYAAAFTESQIKHIPTKYSQAESTKFLVLTVVSILSIMAVLLGSNELCRQRMAVKPPTERSEPISSRINSVSSQFSDGGPAVSPSARSSISSWSEEPAHHNMDISTGHMIL